jgi:hypothetical protein
MSTRIDLSFTDERLLRDSKRRTAANQQALDDRTQTAKDQQAAEQAAEQATPEERPSGVPDIRLERRPSAQRRRQQLQLDPILIRSDTPSKRTYTIISGSEGAIYSISPYLEPGLPERSTELVPGLKDSIIEGVLNGSDGGEVLNTPFVSFPPRLASYSEFYTNLAPDRSGNTTLVGDVTIIDRSSYDDVLAGAYIVNDTLQLIFYRSFTDDYDAKFTFAFGYTVAGVPTSTLFNVVSIEKPKAVVNCLAVTLNLKTKEVKKSSFTFYTFETLRVTKSRKRILGAYDSYGTTRGTTRGTGYVNWRDYEENIYTKELLSFLSSSFPPDIFPFDALPVFLGNYQENYKHTYSDNPAEPRTVTRSFSRREREGGLIVEVEGALTAERAYHNPSTNSLSSAKYHDLFSFLPYANPMYAENVTPIFDTFNFVSVPRWGSYDTRSGNRIVYGGPSAEPPDFSLLELEKVPLPLNAQSLKKYSYPWPQSFVAYNEGRATTTSQQGFVKLNALSATDLERVLSAPAPKFVATVRDLTAPSLSTDKRTLAVNGLWIERSNLNSLPGTTPLPTRIFNFILTSVIGGIGGTFKTYLIPSVLYHIVQK